MSRRKKKDEKEASSQFDQEAADQMAADLGQSAQDQSEEKSSDPLEALRNELQEAKDRALRSHAELENYRKRVARQMQDERRYAQVPLIRDLLPVLDNLDRAIAAAEKTHDATSLLDGVKIVGGQLEDILARHDCVKIDALNQAFDPHLHEAISQVPSADHPANSVMQVAQTGFRVHDRVVRPSQVIVAAAAAEETPNEPSTDENEEGGE